VSDCLIVAHFFGLCAALKAVRPSGYNRMDRYAPRCIAGVVGLLAPGAKPVGEVEVERARSLAGQVGVIGGAEHSGIDVGVRQLPRSKAQIESIVRKSISMPASTESTSLVNKALFSSLDSAIVRFLHRWKVWRHRQEVLDEPLNSMEA